MSDLPTRTRFTVPTHWTSRLPLPRRLPFLSSISVCKKIGLGYVPAVAFMAAVALVALGTGIPLLPVVIIGVLTAGVASVSAMLTAFSVGERVRCVLQAAEAGARGDLDQSVEFRQQGDEVDRLAASFNEMTAELRRRLEAEQHAREEAQRAGAAKSQFLLTMSHELRTPLTVLMGSRALLEESAGTRLTAEDQHYLDQMEQSSEYLLALVNEALEIARVDSGATVLERAWVDLEHDILHPVFDAVSPLADDRRHYLEMDPPAQPVEVYVDPARLRQVLENLLTNAIKFTHPGGSIAIRARIEGRDLVLAVADNGIGIPEEHHDRVFRRFERLHGDRIKASGVGLGLAVAKGIVDLFGGEISFESSTFTGSTFIVRLPDVARDDRADSSDEADEKGEAVTTEAAHEAAPDLTRAASAAAVEEAPAPRWRLGEQL